MNDKRYAGEGMLTVTPKYYTYYLIYVDANSEEPFFWRLKPIPLQPETPVKNQGTIYNSRPAYSLLHLEIGSWFHRYDQL